MSNKGGARIGAGRKPVAVEQKTAERFKQILASLYNGDENGAVIAAWQSGEPSLQKFILEHAFGKPTDNLNLSGGLENTFNYDLSKVKSETLKELLNAATTDQSS